MQFSRIILALALAFTGANAFVPANRMWGARMTSVKMFGEVETKLVGIVAEQLGVEESKVTNDANFANDLGADSLDVVEMVMKIEEEFGVDIPDERAEEVQNLADAVKLIEELQ
eukprot:CAMPEP_0205906214 /NCGR_PEP_ID=MMETSP1325-20131115/1815_1 /ASSEMBLY_ACC=CAM_ASM_000708 /TAXON_ID=236786 /ORGANISM="Florenciella sp., Strain RCC1007" /LENGTH=113 /DNA_ID=CAMNT_0053272211 /DNA_START=77 /DNA_END=418 /DNA_ORIENTATION=-